MSMTWDFILRLFVAGALGTVIGLDREYRAKEAGDVDSMYQLVLQRKGNLSAIEDEMDGK